MSIVRNKQSQPLIIKKFNNKCANAWILSRVDALGSSTRQRVQQIVSLVETFHSQYASHDAHTEKKITRITPFPMSKIAKSIIILIHGRRVECQADMYVMSEPRR